MDRMPFNRPKAEDTEDDILEFQRQFLESGLRPAIEVIKKRKNSGTVTVDTPKCSSQDVEMDEESPKKLRFDETVRSVDVPVLVNDVETEMDEKDQHITSVLTKITERDTLHVPIMFPSHRKNAFPLVHRRIEKNTNNKEKTKKSIFAREFKKKSNSDYGMISTHGKLSERDVVTPCVFHPLPKTIPINQLHQLYPSSAIVSGTGLSSDNFDEKVKIHEENLERLSGMTESDALAEKNKLLQEMNPQMIEFLRKRSKLGKSCDDKSLKQLKEEDTAAQHLNISVNEKSMQPKNESSAPMPSTSYLHMDVVESEKLEWTNEIPRNKLRDIKSSLRFDFNGDIIKDGEDIPTHLGLHHHGEEPDLPGYTSQELFILSRSKFTQQRVLAITLLGKIVTKARSGQYVAVSSENIVGNLLEAGLLFLFRWTLDEQSETLLTASVFALHALLCIPQNEEALNRTFVSDRGCEFPNLSPGVKIPADSNDQDVAQIDVVAGLIRMKILPRIRYILEVVKPGAFVIGQCLDIMKRICSHSLQSAVAVYECPRLMEFIITSLIFNTDQYPQAVALLRAISVAGRHVSSRLLNKYTDVKTIIYKYIGSIRTDSGSVGYCIVTEVMRLWIVLSSYGLLCESFRDLFPIITQFMQTLTAKLSKVNEMCANDNWIFYALQHAQLVCKLCSTSLMSTKSENISEWKELTDQIEIICTLTSEKLQHAWSNSRVTAELKILYGSALDYISCYCNRFRNQFDSGIEKTAVPVLKKAFQHIKTIEFPQSIMKLKEEKIAALPAIPGLADLDCLCDFQFLASYVQCCVAILSLDKSTSGNFRETIVYLAEDCQWMIKNSSSQSFLLRNRVYCLYWSTLLYLKMVATEPDENVNFGHFFFKVAFCCFGQLGNGDEHMMHHILSTALFNSVLLSSIASDATTVVSDMATLDMSGRLSTMAPMPSKIMESTTATLPSIRATYLQSLAVDSKILENSKIRYFHKVHDTSTYLLPSYEDSCAPSDWPFIPLLQLYDYGLSKSLPAGCLTHTVNCLRYLCFIERSCKDCLKEVSLPAKLVRIMCVYIAGNDLFLEPPVKECLAFLFSYYCRTHRKEDINFTQSIPGISSFFDFFLSLLEQYESVSFGDELFGAVVLLPLHQLNGGIQDIKKALWCDHVDLLRMMTIPVSKLLIPLSWYLYPIEIDVFVIRSYLRALASGNCSQARCPVLYTIAVHHTAGFLFDKSIDVPVSQRKEICRGVFKIKDETIPKHILHYKKPMSDDCAREFGFEFSEETNGTRQDDIDFLSR